MTDEIEQEQPGQGVRRTRKKNVNVCNPTAEEKAQNERDHKVALTGCLQRWGKVKAFVDKKFSPDSRPILNDTKRG